MKKGNYKIKNVTAEDCRKLLQEFERRNDEDVRINGEINDNIHSVIIFETQPFVKEFRICWNTNLYSKKINDKYYNRHSNKEIKVNQYLNHKVLL